MSFETKKIICLVRNPLHVIENYANQINTMSHDSKASFSYDQNFKEWWDDWIKAQCDIQKKYFATLQDHSSSKVSVLYVRYEDLI